MGAVVLFSLTSVLNPTLIAVTTVMLLLEHPKRLMLGYWLGAMLMSVTCGLVIVFALENSAAVSTTEQTLSPAADIALGAVSLILSVVLGSTRFTRFEERRAVRREQRKAPRWEGALNRGTARITFVLGAVLTLPGASYIAGMIRLSKLDYSAAVTVLVVLAFNLVMLLLIEIPLLAFVVAPERTPVEVERAKVWARNHGRMFAVQGLAIIGVLLVIKGVVGLVAG